MERNRVAPIGGILLAGGQSRRMGEPKALLRLRPDGPTLIERVLIRLEAVAAQVVVVTNAPEIYAFLGRPLVADRGPGQGPLAGIEAGLRASAHEHNLVVACDMPFLAPDLLAAMAAHPRDYEVLVPRRADGQVEPLHAIYARACLPIISAQLDAGQAKIDRFFGAVRVAYLDEPALRQHDPELRSLRNLNTPEELAAARALAAAEV